MHLQQTHPVGRKPKLYRKYAQMLVDKYECLQDKGVGVTCVYVSCYYSNYFFFISIGLIVFFYYIGIGERSNREKTAEPRGVL